MTRTPSTGRGRRSLCAWLVRESHLAVTAQTPKCHEGSSRRRSTLQSSAPEVQYGALMDESTAAMALAIGQRVRQERQSRRWTLDQLAGAAGVSRRMVVNVEQGAANPSVGTLLRIGDALGVGLPALVAPPAPRPVNVTRRGDGAVLWSS
jgi:DNA-binding XRE family transcriptional regulator